MKVFNFENFAGPVARAYEESQFPVSVIIGPTGGGKSQASARKILGVALGQQPSPRDGIRKARIVCVCPTYRRAHDTVIPSYLKVWPKEWGKYSGGIGDPVDHKFDLQLGGVGGPRVHIEVLFRAVRDESLEEFVRGLETTAWWFPEMDTMPAEDLLSLASNRVGRYPEPDDRPDFVDGMTPSYAGVFGDANAPVIGGWFHKRFWLNKQPGDRLFLQPDAFSGRAENMHNLRRIRPDYYQWLASTMEDYDVGRLLRCKPGWSRNGKPVFEDYDDAEMVAAGPLEADPGLEMMIGLDAGNTLMPAALFGQRDFAGVHKILDEIAPKDAQMDMVELAKECRRKMDTRFPNVRRVTICVDPSAAAKTATNRQISYAQLIQAEAQIEVRLASTNDPKLRISATAQAMKRRRGLVVDPRCVGIREAWTGGYRFKKVGNVYSPNPEKNVHSHIADAGQYYFLGADGLGAAAGGMLASREQNHDGPGVILPS